ncbi:unnamed protein product, partial [Amoebophrya sp. A120]
KFQNTTGNGSHADAHYKSSCLCKSALQLWCGYVFTQDSHRRFQRRRTTGRQTGEDGVSSNKEVLCLFRRRSRRTLAKQTTRPGKE